MNKKIKYTNKKIGLRCNPVTTQPFKNTNGNKSFESVPIRLQQISLFRRQATVIAAGFPAEDSFKSHHSSTLVVRLNGLRFSLQTVHSGSLQIPSRTGCQQIFDHCSFEQSAISKNYLSIFLENRFGKITLSLIPDLLTQPL
jgi:hypothetical protein